MSDNPPNLTGKRLDHALYEALEQHGGVVLGEDHDAPSLMQSVTKLMPQLKAKGVGTVSVELPNVTIEMAHRATTLREFKMNYPNFGEEYLQPLYELVQACKRNHIKVMGHECNQAFHELGKQEFSNDEERGAAAKKRKAVIDPPEGVNKRNMDSMRYVRENAVGRVVIISGRDHCYPITPKGVEKSADKYPAFNELLGYPAIVFHQVSVKQPALFGCVEPDPKNPKNQRVLLPNDLDYTQFPVSEAPAVGAPPPTPNSPANKNQAKR